MSKTIIITGAGSGLGRSLARRLADDGHTLILLGRTRAKLEAVATQIGATAHAIECELSAVDSVRAAFARIAERHPAIDVLINNAAVYQPLFVKDATDAQIHAAVMTNFAGPIYCSRAAIPLLRKGSQIINISSETVALSHAMFSLYQSSKAGLERFSDALHDELEPEGIRVTLARAGAMMDADSKSPAEGALLRRFAEENLKRGIDFAARPVSSFVSVAEVLRTLIQLPDDVNVSRIQLEARHRQ